MAGPTAVGKTELSIQLAETFNSCILSADSRQFYKELNIGTAKPSENQLARVKHHFINTKNVTELYGAGHFAKDAKLLLTELYKTHQVVFLVGGSGLYINALLNGVDDFGEIPISIRENLNQQFLQHGIQWLQSELKEKDLLYYEKVDLNNPQRMIRALEVVEFTGQAYSSFLEKRKATRNFKAIKILLIRPREELYQRIHNRVDEMMKAGLLEEVKQLKAFSSENALKTVGYQELNNFLDGTIKLEEAISKITQHTRNYAKRQLTWFRNQDDFHQFQADQYETILEFIKTQISIS